MRVLVADDEPSTRLAVKDAVERLGHDCLVATNGEQAWEFVLSDSVDVFITDWSMPGLDGPELCRRIRARKVDTYTYTIIATAMTGHADVIEGMQAGADDFLVKPVDPFAVEMRLIAAERVTALHNQITQHRRQLEQLNADLAEQARTDALTKLGNRRRLQEDLDVLHAGAERHSRPYSIAMFDLDHFKAFNDTYGHPCGDVALRRVADVLANETRAGDTAYRFGGEEFIVLLADERLAGAVVAIERFRTLIEKLAILHAGNEPFGVLTISAGVASFERGRGLTSAAVLDLADRALYVAKQRRNSVATLAATEFVTSR